MGDVRDGLMSADREVASILRGSSKPVLYVVNKADDMVLSGAAAEFYKLGVDDIFPVSAEHGLGVGKMLDHLVDFSKSPAGDEDEHLTRVALLSSKCANRHS